MVVFIQLTYRKKRKVEQSTLCQEFVERASRPQELISIDLLEVKTERRGFSS